MKKNILTQVILTIMRSVIFLSIAVLFFLLTQGCRPTICPAYSQKTYKPYVKHKNNGKTKVIGNTNRFFYPASYRNISREYGYYQNDRINLARNTVSRSNR